MQKGLKELGYKIATFQNGEIQKLFYYNNTKQLESILHFSKGTPYRVDLYDEKLQLDYYLKLEKGKWMNYSSKNDWQASDDGWQSFEMIKAMLLKR